MMALTRRQSYFQRADLKIIPRIRQRTGSEGSSYEAENEQRGSIFSQCHPDLEALFLQSLEEKVMMAIVIRTT